MSRGGGIAELGAPPDGTLDALALLRAAVANDTDAWNTVVDHCDPAATLAAMAGVFLDVMGDRCNHHIDEWLRDAQRDILATRDGP